MASTLLKTLASYVPALILQRVATEPAPLRAPATQRLPAVVLYADVMGFTLMAEQFAQQGPAGLEDLTNLLNAYFGQLVDLVMTHGGDVVKFAGDALVALWPASDEPLSTAAQRAAQCAIEIQQRFHEYQVAEGIRLSLRIGLGAGEVMAAHLGGIFGRWEFMLTG
nr:adenylate/guanylate cyclase domain-containing protein [Ardenticatenales bacterium]